jgi:hypothetical protein
MVPLKLEPSFSVTVAVWPAPGPRSLAQPHMYIASVVTIAMTTTFKPSRFPNEHNAAAVSSSRSVFDLKIWCCPLAVRHVTSAAGPLDLHRVRRFIPSSVSDCFGCIPCGFRKHDRVRRFMRFPEIGNLFEGVRESGSGRFCSRVICCITNRREVRRYGFHVRLIGRVVLSTNRECEDADAEN